MISVELLRHYPFFIGFNHDQIDDLARVANEETVLAGHQFISEGEQLTNFYLVLEGTVGIIIQIPDREIKQSLTRQITNNWITREITVTTIREGEIFGWSWMVIHIRLDGSLLQNGS